LFDDDITSGGSRAPAGGRGPTPCRALPARSRLRPCRHRAAHTASLSGGPGAFLAWAGGFRVRPRSWRRIWRPTARATRRPPWGAGRRAWAGLTPARAWPIPAAATWCGRPGAASAPRRDGAAPGGAAGARGAAGGAGRGRRADCARPGAMLIGFAAACAARAGGADRADAAFTAQGLVLTVAPLENRSGGPGSRYRHSPRGDRSVGAGAARLAGDGGRAATGGRTATRRRCSADRPSRPAGPAGAVRPRGGGDRQAARRRRRLDPERFSGHSLRAGFCTAAARHGAPTWRIQQISGHQTHASLERYIRAGQLFDDHPLEDCCNRWTVRTATTRRS